MGKKLYASGHRIFVTTQLKINNSKFKTPVPSRWRDEVEKILVSLAQVLGMSADDIFAAYVKKNAVNFKRQDSGYMTKDHDDSKHI